MAQPEQPKKRGPGRPKNQSKITPPPVAGIITEPSAEGVAIELEYHNPRVLTHAMDMIKKMKSENIVVKFEPDRMVLKARGEGEPKTCAEVTIFGSQIGKYYCADPITMVFKTTTFSNPINKLSANYHKIAMIVNVADKKSRIFIGLTDPTLKTNLYGIPSVVVADDITIPPAEDDPLVICFTHTDFKAQLKSQKSVSQIVRFTVDGKNKEVALESEKPAGSGTGGISLSTKYPFKEKNVMKCTIGEEDIITTSALVSSLEPLAVAFLGPDVVISIGVAGRLTCTVNSDSRSIMGADGAIVITPVVSCKLFVDPLQPTNLGK